MSEPLSERLRACHQYCVKTADEDGMTPEQVEFGTIYREAADLIDALVAALDRWEAAYQTGRHEPLVIAHEAATAVLARAKGESNG